LLREVAGEELSLERSGLDDAGGGADTEGDGEIEAAVLDGGGDADLVFLDGAVGEADKGDEGEALGPRGAGGA
jgi:hypothetical protein